jgi:plastocyanin
MMFITSLSMGLSLLPFVLATNYDVQVGPGAQLIFQPDAIAANPGDQVTFHFNPKNHTVTQSSFASPCGPKDGGIDSGFMPVAPNAASPTFVVTVNDTNPIWVYCKQAAGTANSHCGKGMVFAVNCGADGSPNSFTNFRAAALAIGSSLASAAPSSTAPPSQTTTAAAGSVTVPPAPTGGAEVTATITLQTSTWTTTYSSYPGSPNATPNTLAGNVIKVTVGASGQLAFNPPHVSASPRDIIQFEFHQKNHSVTQSSFANPCVQLNANGVVGFDSDFQPVSADATTFPTWNLVVNDTAPIWAYCRQANHCGSGMVFAVNSVESSARNFSAFQSLAMAINGTGTPSSSNTSASPSSTSKPTSGATSLSVGGAGLALTLGALLASFL